MEVVAITVFKFSFKHKTDNMNFSNIFIVHSIPCSPTHVAGPNSEPRGSNLNPI